MNVNVYGERWDGFPVNDSCPGWHWLIPKNSERQSFPAKWSSAFNKWEIDAFFYAPDDVAMIYSYGGRCLKEEI